MLLHDNSIPIQNHFTIDPLADLLNSMIIVAAVIAVVRRRRRSYPMNSRHVFGSCAPRPVLYSIDSFRLLCE